MASLQSLYHTALCTTHYGIAPPILSQDKDSLGFIYTYPKKISTLAARVYMCELHT